METAIKALAEQVVKDTAALESFAYFGDLPIGETWGFTFAQTRDSDCLEQSNFAAAEAEMSEKFPNDVTVVRCSHWACGWTEYLAVRMLTKRGKPTKAAEAILSLQARVDDYPVLDEEDFSRREWDETTRVIEDVVSTAKNRDLISEDADTCDIISWLSRNDGDFETGSEYYPKLDKVVEAADAFGWKVVDFEPFIDYLKE